MWEISVVMVILTFAAANPDHFDEGPSMKRPRMDAPPAGGIPMPSGMMPPPGEHPSDNRNLIVLVVGMPGFPPPFAMPGMPPFPPPREYRVAK